LVKQIGLQICDGATSAGTADTINVDSVVITK
jgi:hypothetical protein